MRPPSGPQRVYMLNMLDFGWMCFTLPNCTGWLMSASVPCTLSLMFDHLMLSLSIGFARRTSKKDTTCNGSCSCWHFRGNVAFNVLVLFYWRSWHWRETETLRVERKKCWLLKRFGRFFFTNSLSEHGTSPYHDWCCVPDKTGRTKLYEPGPVSQHHSLLKCCFFFSHFSPFFTTSLSFLLPLPSTAAPERLFLELTWLFKDVKFILCHEFSGRKLLFCFSPLTSSSFPSLYPLVASQKPVSSHQHTFFFSYTPASLSLSLSYHYNHTSLHTYTLLLIPPSLFLTLLYHFWLGKRGEKIFQSVIICNILLLCLWNQTFTVLAPSFTFYSNSCKTVQIWRK